MKNRCLICCISAALILCMVAVRPCHAELTPLEDTCMEEICGAAGVSIALKNIQIFHHIDTIGYCASDNGAIEFQNFYMHGAGDVALFNYDFGTVTDSGIIYLDVFECEVAPVNPWTGASLSSGDQVVRGMTSTIVPNWDQELGYTVGSVVFHDPNTSTGFTSPIDLGSVTMGLIDMPRFATYTSPRPGGSGFDFQHSFQMTIDKIGYAYNNSCDAIELCPTYIGGSFADLTGDDPRFPSTWKPNKSTPVDFGDFQIGDLFGDISDADPTNWVYSNPASIDAFEGDINGTGTIYGVLNLGLPMSGSIRFENVDFNGTDFGPGAIDGLEVHRLTLQLIP